MRHGPLALLWVCSLCEPLLVKFLSQGCGRGGHPSLPWVLCCAVHGAARTLIILLNEIHLD
jgi:hypothetical protein